MHTRVEGLRNACLRRQRLREVRKDETLAEWRMERGYFRQRVSANTGGGSKVGLGECWSFHVALVQRWGTFTRDGCAYPAASIQGRYVSTTALCPVLLALLGNVGVADAVVRCCSVCG